MLACFVHYMQLSMQLSEAEAHPCVKDSHTDIAHTNSHTDTMNQSAEIR